MKTLKIISIILLVLLVIGLAITSYNGMFRNIVVEEKIEGGYQVIGLEYTGPYAKAGHYVSETDKKLKEAGVSCTNGFGIYYDDPKVTPEEKCRSFVGGILDEKDFIKIPQLMSKGFKIDSVIKAPAIVVEFPIRNNLSYMIGAMKAYPAMSKIMAQKGYTPTLSLEIYKMSEKKILYIMQYKGKI